LTDDTPEEIIEKAYSELKLSLSDEILEKIKSSISPKQFEFLVVDILAAIGYGGGSGRKQNLIEVTSYSQDYGIDGIIKEDPLGLDLVCIQAKRYINGSIGRPDVQGFAGSLDGQGAKKGIFITTSSFTKEAIKFAKDLREKRIILIDGQELALLMIENGVGVSEINRYMIHKIDNDYFESFD
jgi:restriction system protein